MLSIQAIGLGLVAIHHTAVRGNSQAVESSQRTQIRCHQAQSGQGETHMLSNKAIRLRLVVIQLRADWQKLTHCRIQPSGTD
jgi:hypothetical protein